MKGENGEYYKFGEFCGNEIPTNIIANDTIKIQFISDLSTQRNGFKIFFTTSFPYEPEMLMNSTEMEYLDGLKIMYENQRVIFNANGEFQKMLHTCCL